MTNLRLIKNILFNNVIKRNNIKRNIDKTHFHDLVEDLGEEYVGEYKKIFEE
jgi:hypothetical protein